MLAYIKEYLVESLVHSQTVLLEVQHILNPVNTLALFVKLCGILVKYNVSLCKYLARKTDRYLKEIILEVFTTIISKLN
jgi:hypothetical protein